MQKGINDVTSRDAEWWAKSIGRPGDKEMRNEIEL